MIPKQGKLTTPAEIASDRIRNVAPIVRQAWRLLMENHPHDSICGCSIDQVHHEMRSRFDQVEQIGEEVTRQSLESLAAQVDTRPASGAAAQCAILVFNASDTPRNEPVEVGLPIAEATDEPGRLPGGLAICDADGQALPCQVLGTRHPARPCG